MKIKILVVMAAAILTLTHCKKNADLESKTCFQVITINEQKTGNVHFSLKASISTNAIAFPMLALSEWQDKIILYGLSTYAEKKNMLVAQSYNKKLKFLGEKFFFPGQGPGDVGNFNIISMTKDKILISDNSNKRVSIYVDDWTYLTSLKHKLPLDAFEIFENGKIFMEKKHIGLKNNKFTYDFLLGSFPDFNSKVIYQWEPFEQTVLKGDSIKLVIGCESEQAFFYKYNEVFLLVCKKYHLIKFDNAGNKLKDIIVKVDEIKTDHTRDELYLKELGFLERKNSFVLSDTINPTVTMIPLKKGFVVVRRYEFITPCNEWVPGDYFSYQFEYLGRIKVPCSYNLLAYRFGRTNKCFKYDDGFLYLIQEKEDSTIIEKWEVTE